MCVCVCVCGGEGGLYGRVSVVTQALTLVNCLFSMNHTAKQHAKCSRCVLLSLQIAP